MIMGWRRFNHFLHRDLGYLCIGLTIIYAISGLVVNHTSHGFNPSYTIEKSVAEVMPLEKGGKPDSAYVSRVLQELGETAPLKNAAMLSPGMIRIFVEGNTLDVNLATGQVVQEKVNRRPFLYAINSLHLNKIKGAWTWFADVYAVALFLLALTGMLMIRGKGTRRGLILTAIGIVGPVIYLLL